MPDIIKTAERTEKRKFNKVFNNDLRKYLTEIITNSDDSYNRLEEIGAITSDTICPIFVLINSTLRQVEIIDNAEGMDLEGLKKNFGEYGADTSGWSEGRKVRGLFGQGATDVLLNASLYGKVAEILSIKNSQFYTGKFKWDGNVKSLDRRQSKIHKTELRKLRDRYKIPANGTIVRFGLPDEVRIPRNLAEEISNFYMLRFILSKPNRRVVLLHTSGKKEVTHELKYVFPPKSVLLNKSISFAFENKQVTGNLVIESRPSIDSFGELKILSYDDEKSVYDNSLFGYEKYPHADDIYGYLELNGASSIIRSKLNQKIPEEILTETRDGFNTKHAFYKDMCKAIEPHILSVLQIINTEKKEKEVTLSKQKEWNDAFKEINKYFKDELEEELGTVDAGTNPPIEGLRFIFPSIKVTVGKKYSLKLLINNDLLPIGSQISLKVEDGNLEISPTEFQVSKNDVIYGSLSAKSISIVGLISNKEQQLVTANSQKDTFQAKLFVSVIDQEIHEPKYGLEFWPSSVVVKANTISKGHLFFDTTKHPIGSEVVLSTNNVIIELIDKSIIFGNEHLISENIGAVECRFSGKTLGTRNILLAKIGNASAELSIGISNQLPPPEGNGGFITGVGIKNSDMFWQTFFNPRDGKININSGNNINELHLGKITDSENPKFSKEQNKYLAELCASELARQMIKRKIEKGKILDSDYESALDAIQKEKNKLFELFIRYLEKLI